MHDSLKCHVCALSKNCSYVYVLEFTGPFVTHLYEGVRTDRTDERGKEYSVIYRSDRNAPINVSPEGGGGDTGWGWGLWSETQISWQTSPALGKVSSSKFPTEGIEIQEVDRLNNTHTPGLKIAVFSCNNWNERTLEETNGLSVTKDWANFYYFSFLHLVSALRGLLGIFMMAKSLVWVVFRLCFVGQFQEGSIAACIIP